MYDGDCGGGGSCCCFVGGCVLVSVAIGRDKTHAALIAMSMATHCKKADPDVPAAIARTTVLSHTARTKTQYIGLQVRACWQIECIGNVILFFFSSFSRDQ